MVHYIHARVLYRQDRRKEAIASLHEAISLDPSDADYYGLLAAMLMDDLQFAPALEAAERGLSYDPEHVLCLNIRSRLLFKLDRKQEAVQTIDKALEQDPDNASTHANYGWAWLEKGDAKQALEHFRMALQLDPTMAYAKEGMKEALKGRYWVYRQYLRYAFWISNQSSKRQWIFIIGIYVIYRLVRSAAESNAELAPFLTPIILLYFLFVFSSWLMNPLGNLFLMLNTYGRYTLTESDRRAATFVGISLGISLLGFASWIATDLEGMLALGYLGFTLMIPLGSMDLPGKPKDRKFLNIYTLGLLLLGLGAVALALTSGELFNGCAILYLLGFFVYQWVANAKMTR
ncbi:lipoprotein NlpI [Cesiribacter andamanensis AMV16]|uniref:Lipoprotein NlpI n=2 Tax=Cesiribacter TaxID=1133570 RepID=M7N083_9BACT|nr:lipoprotein NlpI [Cesiribacter andamanensis AMV16]